VFHNHRVVETRLKERCNCNSAYSKQINIAFRDDKLIRYRRSFIRQGPKADNYPIVTGLLSVLTPTDCLKIRMRLTQKGHLGAFTGATWLTVSSVSSSALRFLGSSLFRLLSHLSEYVQHSNHELHYGVLTKTKPKNKIQETKNCIHNIRREYRKKYRATGRPLNTRIIEHKRSIKLGKVKDALKMEAASTSETSVNFYQTTRRNNPEDSNLHF
jgi:hypothetical protein